MEIREAWELLIDIINDDVFDRKKLMALGLACRTLDKLEQMSTEYGVKPDDLLTLAKSQIETAKANAELQDKIERGELVEVVHGEWVEIGMRPCGTKLTHYCSVCESHGNDNMNYCPNCGAKMGKGQSE